MKLFKKLNQKGFGHHIIIPVIVVLVVGGIGAYILTRGHAAPLSPAQQKALNAASSAQVVDAFYADAKNPAGIKHNPNSGSYVANHAYNIAKDPGFPGLPSGLQYSSAWRVSVANIQDHYEWYGPSNQGLTDINYVVHSNKQGVYVCWLAAYFTSEESEVNAKLQFSNDLFYGGHSHGVWSEPMYHPTVVSSGQPIPAYYFCHHVPTGPGTLQDLEARVRLHHLVIDDSPPSYNGVYLDILNVRVLND